MSTPNCAICEWAGYIWFESGIFCSAQGTKRAKDCYNNELCIKLFKPKKEEKEQK